MAFSFDFLDDGTVLEWSVASDSGNRSENSDVICERIIDYTPTLYIGTDGDRSALDSRAFRAWSRRCSNATDQTFATAPNQCFASTSTA